MAKSDLNKTAQNYFEETFIYPLKMACAEYSSDPSWFTDIGNDPNDCVSKFNDLERSVAKLLRTFLICRNRVPHILMPGAGNDWAINLAEICNFTTDVKELNGIAFYNHSNAHLFCIPTVAAAWL